MKMKIIPIMVILEKLFSFPYEIISTRAYTVKRPSLAVTLNAALGTPTYFWLNYSLSCDPIKIEF